MLGPMDKMYDKMGQKYQLILLKHLKDIDKIKIFQISAKKADEYNNNLNFQLNQNQYQLK